MNQSLLLDTDSRKYNFREQDKEWGKIAVTRQFFALSERFAKWETHLAFK